MARVQVGYDPRAEALQTTAAPNIATEQARFDPRSSSAFQLAEALGKAQPVIDQFNQDYERKKAQDALLQNMKVESYKEQFQRDNQSGAVVDSQVKKVFPEVVPVVAARVAESVGLDFGRTQVNALIDEINSNDALRLDSKARADFIAKKRAEIVGNIGKEDEFYKSGVIRGVDQELRGWENGWQRQTADYHQLKQKEAFSNEVSQVLAAGGDLTEVDKKWATSSSLNNAERKKLVVDSVIARAHAEDNPALLSKIPTVFLNDEYKKSLKQAELQITQIRIGKVRDARFLEQNAREDATRGAKTDIINKLAKGGQVDPGMYRGDPEAFDYAMRLKDAGRLPDVQSVGNATKIRTSILNGSTVGTMSQNQVIDQIITNPSMNPKEKQKLIEDVPKLMEGMLIMRDESTTSAISNRLDPVIKAIETGPFARIFQVQGINIRGQAMSMFQSDLQASLLSWYEDPNLGKGQQWPTGMAKQELLRAAIERTEANITKMAEMYTKAGGNGTQAPASPAPVRRGATTGPGPTQADIDYVRKNPQSRQQFINTFGREP
ncbi:hypothetical protein UFOVP562_12 [uncultured Caudovirales phage]|uniref:Uncharacterized protein n=1 Tax=uncultured Caudovirales phage TaxID=2100421 RepID=A0A6J5MSI3_9CAUD|nr:hypothetical protein UFOVP562_12 [uncultured Caudovirales phage]